jgi:hypothetical protein
MMVTELRNTQTSEYISTVYYVLPHIVQTAPRIMAARTDDVMAG